MADRGATGTCDQPRAPTPRGRVAGVVVVLAAMAVGLLQSQQAATPKGVS